MDKTISINLAGTLFQIDEEAFRLLRDYLQAINTRFENVRADMKQLRISNRELLKYFSRRKVWPEL